MEQPDDLQLMACPDCDEVAEITQMDFFDANGVTVVMWRTHCLNRHFRDNFWYHHPTEEGTNLKDLLFRRDL